MTARLIRPRASAIFLIGIALAATAMWVRLGAYRQLEEDLSSLARFVIRESSVPLRPVASSAAVVYASDPREAAIALEEAEYALPEISNRLGVPAPKTRVNIFFISDEAAWSKIVRERGARPDGLAMIVGREIFLRHDPEQAARPDRLAHELTHFVLHQNFGEKIPLWLDEGLALRIGSAVSRAYRATRGRRIEGVWPALEWPPEESLESLTSRASVPDDPETARLFYRASEEMVAWIDQRLSSAQMREFIAAVARGDPWQVVLSNSLKETRFSLSELAEDIRRAAEAPKKR